MLELTDEQIKIIDTIKTKDKVIKINAFAGCGKSSTLVSVVDEIRKTDKDSKILYIVFNRSMLEEAKSKFEGLNVECYTTHGFALKRFSAIKDGEVNVIPALDFNVFMELKNKPKYSKKWVRFKTINDLLNAYCLCYDTMEDFITNVFNRGDKYGITDKISYTERDFFKDIYEYMIDSKIYTHGMYLKEYACNCGDKISGYKYVLLDEAQDCSSMFYCIFKRMKYDKTYIVGDSKQNIYQFLKTINVFDKIDGKTFNLSKSFRINNMECKLANEVLSKHYDDFKKGSIKNYFDRNKIEDRSKKTILFRLNSTLFEYAVDLISKVDNIKVKFMDVHAGNNADKFETCFSDMLYFYYRLLESQDVEKAKEFKNKFSFSICKLVDNYIKICKKEGLSLYHYLYKNKAILPLDYRKYFNFFLLNELNIIEVVDKVKQSEDCKNPDKTYYLSTAHRFKGCEAEHVKIAPDDWSLKSDSECNLCYVAVTRATKKLEAQPILELLSD